MLLRQFPEANGTWRPSWWGPLILEVALNGITGPERNPAAPRLPAELARDAIACLDAGAAIVHTHTHQPALSPAEGAALYLAAYRPILDARPDAILYPTIGLGASFDDRYAHHDHLAEAGAIRQGLVDPGSVNFGESAPGGRPLDVDFVYRNGPRDIAATSSAAAAIASARASRSSSPAGCARSSPTSGPACCRPARW